MAKSLLNSELLPGTKVAKLLLNLEKLPKIKVAKSLLKSEQLDQWTKVAKSKVDLFHYRMPHFRILLQQRLHGKSVLFKPKKAAWPLWSKGAFHPQGSLPWTKAANLLFRISVNKKLAWTKVANQLFEFLPTRKHVI